jgi:cytochrome c-type biogenesis protein CcmH
MVLWIAMAVLAAAACLPLLMALTRAPRAVAANAPVLAIYRDQLDEIGRDVQRGVVAAADAEAARTEIARRLIRADAAPAADVAPQERLRRFATVAIVAMPILALIFYLAVGSPTLPDQPLAARPDAEAQREVLALVKKVETHLAAEPDDGQGWEVLAPVYRRLGRTADAVNAYTHAIDLLGPTAEREGDLGEAIVAANNGAVTPEAHAAFERAHQLSPDDPRPRFYIALALTQAGRTDEARAAWQALLANAPADQPWVQVAERALAQLGGPLANLPQDNSANLGPGSSPPSASAAPVVPGPSAADVAAASQMAPADRQAMIEGMVATLAERLKSAPDDPDGWARLIRSYVVLGRKADAETALGDARTALAGDSAKLAPVEAVAAEFQLGTATP